MDVKIPQGSLKLSQFIFVIAIFVSTMQSTVNHIYAQDSIPESAIPKNLEIVLASAGGGPYGGTSRLIIREDRRIEVSSYGFLPMSRPLVELLKMSPGKKAGSRKYETEQKRPGEESRKARAKLNDKVQKETLLSILKKFVEVRFSEMDPKLMCVNKPDEAATYTTHSSSKGISISFDGFTMNQGAYSGCEPVDGTIVEQRQRFYDLYDFILASLTNVRRIKVPWRSTEERILRRNLEQGQFPESLEIMAKSEYAGLGSRLVINPDRTVTKANYSTRNAIALEGIKIADFERTDGLGEKRDTVIPKALKAKVSKQFIKRILEQFVTSGFFDLNQKLSADANVSGPREMKTVAIKFEGAAKTAITDVRCGRDLEQPNVKKLCELFFLIQQSAKGVTAKEEGW